MYLHFGNRFKNSSLLSIYHNQDVAEVIYIVLNPVFWLLNSMLSFRALSGVNVKNVNHITANTCVLIASGSVLGFRPLGWNASSVKRNISGTKILLKTTRQMKFLNFCALICNLNPDLFVFLLNVSQSSWGVKWGICQKCLRCSSVLIRLFNCNELSGQMF